MSCAHHPSPGRREAASPGPITTSAGRMNPCASNSIIRVYGSRTWPSANPGMGVFAEGEIS